MTITDNDKRDVAAVHAEIPQLAKKLANKTLAALKQEGVFIFPEHLAQSEDLDQNQLVLQRIDQQYHTGNVMGFLGCGKEQLVISSRFSSEKNDYFLQYMLDRVFDCPNVFNLESNVNTQNQLFHLFLLLFPLYLKAAMRKGLFKTYIRVPYNDAHLKGSLNVARHIKENTPFTGSVAYDQRQLSLDNQMSQLIRHTIEYIKGKPNGNQILARAKDDVKHIVEVTTSYRLHDRRKVLVNNQKHPIRHAYFWEYRALQRLCICILQHQKQQMGLGSQRIAGVLFDGAWLWEEYVNTLVGEQFYHPKNKARNGAEQLFHGERNLGLIYPDFIGRHKSDRKVADAKYKPISNISGRDYLQILAYMMRFEAKQGYYFYPEAEGKTCVPLQLNRGTAFEGNVTPREDVFVIKQGLKIPKLATDYEDFCRRMAQAEKEFVQGVFPE